ncbi:MAG: alginate lyase family protein [Thiohalocapsa sp.]|uniref:alginate lyase family protein n=1 Tax=Thiohalocapsa sp. TaxID=2497641 RepID=UPI0025D75AE6|nr:alginate lyase family protein [Thiohalocapsa sp.]MCG6941974.1 alginate lyase family protein [Thiohalocapsa sp.]
MPKSLVFVLPRLTEALLVRATTLRRRLQRRWSVRSRQLQQALRRWAAPSEQRLRAEYAASAISREPDEFVLYRIIGNDLYPRHAIGQSRTNVEFILRHEPKLERCTRRWILNRIVDQDEEDRIVALLEAHGETYLRLPFSWLEYDRSEWDWSCLPRPDFLYRNVARRLCEEEWKQIYTALYRQKNLLLMNNNGARNVALNDGRNKAKWILPWDGNCFLTESGWESLLQAVDAAPHAKFFVVPMHRAQSHDEVLSAGFVPNPTEEPQLVFRRDTVSTFDERIPYGRRPKVDLLWRLGVPGPWDQWAEEAWDVARRPLSSEFGQWRQAGWVTRLFSGHKHLEQPTKKSSKSRGVIRQRAIAETLNHVAVLGAGRNPHRRGGALFSMEALQESRTELARGIDTPRAAAARRILGDAEQALQRETHVAARKESPASISDRRDYNHSAPQHWPSADAADGLPNVEKEGQCVAGTRRYEEERRGFDRTRWRRFVDDTTTLALATSVSEDGSRYAEHALRLVHAWLCDAADGLYPQVEYPQIGAGRDNERNPSWDIIEFRDLYYLLDALQVLEHVGGLPQRHKASLSAWLSEHLNWLRCSPAGRAAQAQHNSHATYYDLQMAAICAYTGREEEFEQTVLRAASRLPEHFATDGTQPIELQSATPKHACCSNLQGWLNLMLLAERNGMLLVSAAGPDRTRIARAVEWALREIPRLGGEDSFDDERLVPLLAAARRAGLSLDTSVILPAPADVNARFDPDSGIHPYWQLTT